MSDDVDRIQKQEGYMQQRRQKVLNEIESADDKPKKVAFPNPKYKQATKIAKQFDLHWHSLVENYGCWMKRLTVKNNDEVYYYDIQFTEDQLESSSSSEYLVKEAFKRAIYKLAKSSGLSEKDVALKVLTEK